MAQDVVSIPLIPGVRQDVDRTLLPAGSLVAASGVRTRKGFPSKANGMLDAKGTAASGGPTFAGPCDALGYAAGREVAVMAGHVWARENQSSQFQPVGRASRARPVKAHWSAFTDATSGVTKPALAVIGNHIAHVHYDGSGVQLAIMDPSGLRKQAATFSTRTQPRIFAVGNTFVLVFRATAGTQIYGVTIDGTTLAVSGETALVTVPTVDDSFDAAPFTATLWLLGRRSGTTSFDVSTWTTSLGSGATANRAVTCNNAAVTACSVYGTSGEGIWATFDDQSAQKVAAFTTSLGASSGPNGFASAVTPPSWPALMTRRSATTVWLVWSEPQTGPNHFLLRVKAVDTSAANAGSDVGYAWHLRPASRPWAGDLEQFKIWVHTDNAITSEAVGVGGAAWALQRRYTLCTFAFNTGTPTAFGMFVEPELSPDERSNREISYHPPEVAFRSTTDESGASVTRGYFPALSTIRTQGKNQELGSSALVVYEWETEAGFDARTRQISEVGGQGVVFGGGLQEIPSARRNFNFSTDTFARGVENNFLFPPAILRADDTATGADGLTAGALYKFVAVFEYITTDGLRVRSAPSNIVEVTPAVGQENVDLRISTCPTTEREFSSPPNQTVAHIYATVGGGATFHRITPDTGVTAGRGTTSVGIITYVHSVADSTYNRNEGVYTDTGDLDNQPAPAHRFGWVGGGYAWVGGLFNPAIIERSKASAVNEPVRFTRDNANRCLLPEACTGGAWMDGMSVVFSRTGIYLVPPTLGAPQRLPSTVGCIDFRSVVEMPDGIGFQSRRGYEILPRGFGTPQLISGAVEDALRGRRVISATVTGHAGSAFASAARLGERLLVLFAIDPALSTDPGVRLVFDLDARRWLSIDPAMAVSGAIGETLTTWNGRLVAASRTGTNIRAEDPTDWGATEAVPVSYTVADLRPFDVLRRGQLSRVLVLGEVRSTTEVTLTAYQDGKYSEPFRFQKPMQLVAGTAGDKFLLEWQLPIRQCNAITLKLDCADPAGVTPGEGVVLHAIGLEADGLPGRPRVSQERAAA